jgi:hypothetical protein
MSTTETKDTSLNHQPEKQTPAMRSEKSEKRAEHPITRAITSLIHKLRDFEDCADEYVSAAGEMQVERIKRVAADLGNSVDLLKNKDKRTKVLGLKQLVDGMPKIVQVIRANPARVLRESLFVGMFSAFDAFTGDLLRALFLKKPALFSSSKRQIEVSALMESDTLDDLKRRLIDDEIEAFRRESYVEQFSRLEQMFSLKLRSFSRWPDFVERSQRRNLLTHCDGVVSDQYLCMCKKVGMPCTEKLGTRLGISLKYLKETVEVLMEVGLKLGHTLWRKVLPDELEQADKSLNNEIYERLQDGKWDPALTLAEFAIEQPRVSDDAMKKTFTVNYTIAAKFGGQEEKAKEFLASLDWTAAAPRFQLARRCWKTASMTRRLSCCESVRVMSSLQSIVITFFLYSGLSASRKVFLEPTRKSSDIHLQ